MNAWGRFTVRGGSAVEERIRSILVEIAEIAGQAIPAQNVRSLVLFGGYGRGEGGVAVIDGVEHPHNNLDFLLITKNLSLPECNRSKRDLNERLKSLKESRGIEFDISLIPETKLSHSPCLVMWYDMRFGHKTILGDAEFVPSLRQFSLEKILPSDIRNLLVNRGTLLVINELLLNRGELSPAERKLFVKHAMKAVIGYGDALLYFLGAYHWSYVEKQKRMRERSDVDDEFRRIYDAAMEFRFAPDYDRFLNLDFSSWLESLRFLCAPVHLQCEALRLGQKTLAWDSYPGLAFEQALWDGWNSLRGVAKKGYFLLRGPAVPPGLSWKARLGYRCGGMREVLPLFFPLIAYHLPNREYWELVTKSLNARSAELVDLRTAYLRAWSAYGDDNFFQLLRKYQISLDDREKTA